MLNRFFFALVAAFLLPLSMHAQVPEPEDYAIEPALRAPILNPDGSKMAYRVAQTKKGDYILEIRDVDNLGAEPVRIGTATMQMRSFQWISNDHVLINFEMQVRDLVKDQEQSAFQSRRAIARADGKGSLVEVYDDLSVVSTVPSRPNEVLVETNKFRWEDLSKSDLSDAFDALSRTPDYYWMNVNNGAVQLAFRGNSRFGGYQFDSKGNGRIAAEYDDARREIVYYSRKTNEDEWVEIYRVASDDYAHRAELLGFDPANENGFFIATTRAPDGTISDTQSVYELDLTTGELGAKIVEIPGQDAFLTVSGTGPNSVGTVTGFVYYDEEGNWQRAFIDAEAGELQASLDATFPGKRVSILSQSADKTRMTLNVRDYFGPSTFYLVKDGTLQKIGDENPALTDKHVSRVDYIEYEARDGRMIPAYVTIPDGEGPFPLVVMPHGGPWVSYRIDGYDEWSQMLASQGFMVLDPLFRGTTGLGTDHWLSSFGEWGKAMSDDMDDGALYLVEQGLADRNRMAVFGWSFGGYSALAASIRQPQIYQCTIAGAPVSDPETFRAAFSRLGSPDGRALRDQLEVGYTGLSATDEASKVSVPVLVIHGKVDRRVRIFHSRNFVSALKRNNKPHEFLVLDTADHFSNYLTYDHKSEMYERMVSFLSQDCGIRPTN